jgi:poly(beta-D-mannuronate) lyase
MKHLTTLIAILLATSGFAAVKTINPTQSNSTWNSTLNSLSAGDTVFLEDGIYTNFQVQIRGNGTATNPILVRARNYGNARIQGEMRVQMGGNFITLDGLIFANGKPVGAAGTTMTLFEFRSASGAANEARDCRLTNCVFDSIFTPGRNRNTDDNERWIGIFGYRNQIDNCYFGFKNSVGGVLIFVDPRNNPPATPSDHIIERNFFSPREYYTLGNGAETLRIGDSDRSQFSVRCTVRENIFFRTDGEIEIISIKSCDNLIEGNLVFEAAGQFTCRHGHRNTIRNNVFIGNNKTNTSGVRVINSDQKVYNNWFQDIRGTGNRSALSVMKGLDPSCPLNSYYQVKNAEISYNTFINCARVEFGTNVSTNYSCSQNQGVMYPIINSRFRNNIIFNTTLERPFDTVVNAVPSVTGVTFEGNMYRVHERSAFARQGFSLRPTMNFEKNGLFYDIVPAGDQNCIPVITGQGGISEIETHVDVTGHPRQRPFTAGAKNNENFPRPPKIPTNSEVGVSWYNYPKPSL